MKKENIEGSQWIEKYDKDDKELRDALLEIHSSYGINDYFDEDDMMKVKLHVPDYGENDFNRNKSVCSMDDLKQMFMDRMNADEDFRNYVLDLWEDPKTCGDYTTLIIEDLCVDLREKYPMLISW